MMPRSRPFVMPPSSSCSAVNAWIESGVLLQVGFAARGRDDDFFELRRGAERNAADDGRGQRSQAQIVSTHARFPLRKNSTRKRSPNPSMDQVRVSGNTRVGLVLCGFAGMCCREPTRIGRRETRDRSVRRGAVFRAKTSTSRPRRGGQRASGTRRGWPTRVGSSVPVSSFTKYHSSPSLRWRFPSAHTYSTQTGFSFSRL